MCFHLCFHFATTHICAYPGENKAWDAYVHREAVEWQNTIIGWLLRNKEHPVMVVKFEDLKRSTVVEVKRMLDFLLVPYTMEKVLEVVGSEFAEFRRKHQQSFEHFTPEQKEFVTQVLRTTMKLLNARKLSNVCNILDYINVKE